MQNWGNIPRGLRRSRRNLVRVGAITASAIFASLLGTPAKAAPFDWWHRHHGGGGQPMCFLAGTMIRTADGARKVEELRVGDLLPGHFGGIRPIQWIGRYSFKRPDSSKPWVRDVLPVRISRSALGPDIPHADLYVTPGHSVLIDGTLVPACNLVNGTSITVYEADDVDALNYFHIKLETHDVIYAEGAPCETLVYLDENAPNFAEYRRQNGPPEIEAGRCAPWAGCGRRVEVQSRLRSALSPWIDRRLPLDVIRDGLEEGRTVLAEMPGPR